MDGARKLIGVCGVQIYEQNVMPFMDTLKMESEKKGFHLVCFSGSSRNLENTEEIIGQYELVELIRHVVEEHGCRYVNMIAGDKGNRFSEERIEMYRKVLEENGIPFEQERIGYGNFWERPVTGVMIQFLESDLPFPEAIVCANDSMAHAAIAILNEHGYEVPEDIIVTGYDGTNDGYIFPVNDNRCAGFRKNDQAHFGGAWQMF